MDLPACHGGAGAAGRGEQRGGRARAPEANLALQRKFFEGREAELIARHPGKFIAVCAGEVFVGDNDTKDISKAEAAHPDRPILLNAPDTAFEDLGGTSDDPAGSCSPGGTHAPRHGADAAPEADLARQRELLEGREAELIARHPGKFIAVCAGEVFVGDGPGEATSKAEAAHPDRPITLHGNGEFVGCL